MGIRQQTLKPSKVLPARRIMEKILICTIAFVSFTVFAGDGPNSIGVVRIGMNKADYETALGINPVDCNTIKDEKVLKSEMEYLNSNRNHLCIDLRGKSNGIVEHIQLENISYDVIQANSESSKYIDTIGRGSTAIFTKDRLISLTVISPKVDYKTLSTKYGEPKLIDNRSIKICKNKIGNEFMNNEGDLDAIWTNDEVTSIFRTYSSPPYKTCADGGIMHFYILEERKELKLIEAAIKKFQETISKKTANESQF